MTCPNCGQPMKEMTADKQNILHCSNCGGSFFEENGINRITSQTAFELSQDKQSDEISGDKKFCPHDEHQLEIVAHSEESLPPEVTLLRCPECRGIFSFPEDLINFKKAQDAKINFFSTWKIPLASFRSVAILSVVAFLSALLFTVSLYSRPGINSQARDMLKKEYITREGALVFFSFQTSQPVRSELLIDDRTTASVVTRTVSSSKKTFHEITVSGLQTSHSLYYQIILTDTQGRQVKTAMKKLELGK